MVGRTISYTGNIFNCNGKYVMGPKIVIAELVDGCHLRCALCWNRDRKASNKQMSLKIVDKILKRYDNSIYEIVWYNWGEPLLHKEFETFAHMAGKSNAQTTISSSMSLPLTDERLKSLSNFNRVNISLSGMTADMYKIYHTNGNFDLVMDNLKRLAQLKLQTIMLIWLTHKHHAFQTAMAREFADSLNFGFIEQQLNCCIEELVSGFDHELLRVQKYPYGGHSCRIQHWDTIDVDGNYLLCCGSHNVKIGYSIDDAATMFPFPRNKELREAKLKTSLCVTCRENEYWRMF